ncbi:MAG: hypothetical protein CMB99_16195 [Flavobacteriaceae bacterium]|nr:hypothetical protein [Flavobacteriaceae bacterium]|tara:strand:- start:18534 stop:18773 length:240 start_codon:yes stop_codon:yes gene_type:complete
MIVNKVKQWRSVILPNRSKAKGQVTQLLTDDRAEVTLRNGAKVQVSRAGGNYALNDFVLIEGGEIKRAVSDLPLVSAPI